jgi:hypothetical protein
MAEILAPTVAAATSADQVLAVGGSLTLVLKPATGAAPLRQYDANVDVQAKTSGGDYLPFGALTASNPVLVLTATGTFRVSKPASSVAYGVDGS